MPRPSTKQELPVKQDPPPRRKYEGGTYMNLLTPLTQRQHLGQWFLIKTCESEQQAWNTQSNLTARKVIIPRPDWDWTFSARGFEVYAICRGPVKPVRSKRKR